MTTEECANRVHLLRTRATGFSRPVQVLIVGTEGIRRDQEELQSLTFRSAL